MRHRHALRDVATLEDLARLHVEVHILGAPRNEAPTHQMKRRLTNSFLIASVADKAASLPPLSLYSGERVGVRGLASERSPPHPDPSPTEYRGEGRPLAAALRFLRGWHIASCRTVARQ